MGLRSDFAAISSDCSRPSRQRVLLIHRNIQGPIINDWLILATVLGAMITVADGLTRVADPELGLIPPQPLAYEANHAAFLFAAVTFPLLVAYAKKVRIRLSEGLFLWFTFCTTAYAKDFSYLRLPGAPLFVTDVVLLVLLLSMYLVVPRRQNARHSLAQNIFLVLFVTAGSLAAARGFWGYGNPILVLRDSALVLYALFLLIGHQLFGSWLSIKRLAVWFLAGTSLSVLNGLAWFVVAPEQRRFVLPGIFVLIALIATLLMMADRLIRSKTGWALTALFMLGLLLANARSLFVALSIVLASILVIPGMIRKKIGSTSVLKALATASVLACALVFFSLYFNAGRNFTALVADQLDSGILHTNDDPYWQFRVAAWHEAWRRFEEYPAGGEGFGIPFVFENYDNDPRPHNSFLTVLYKMGFSGFLPLSAFLAYFFWLALRTIQRNLENQHVAFLQIVFLAQLSFCVYGAAFLMLESPYLAALFWSGMGIGLRMTRKLELERSLRSVLDRYASNNLQHLSPAYTNRCDVRDALGGADA